MIKVGTGDIGPLTLAMFSKSHFSKTSLWGARSRRFYKAVFSTYNILGLFAIKNSSPYKISHAILT